MGKIVNYDKKLPKNAWKTIIHKVFGNKFHLITIFGSKQFGE